MATAVALSTPFIPSQTVRFRSSPLSVAGLKRESGLSVSKRRVTTRQRAWRVAMTAKSTVEFSKYQGIGNDFILVDNRNSDKPIVTPEQAVKMCNRNYGVGADGVIFAMKATNGADYRMRIFNSDGSEPEMCGNGIRCMARFVAELEGRSAGSRKTYTIDTLAGTIVPELLETGVVRVDMGEPILKGELVPTKLPPTRPDLAGGAVVASPLSVDGKTWSVTCVSMGNPHCVVFVEPGTLDKLDLARVGPMFEKHAVFPAKTNTEFVEVISRTHLRMKVWERGAGATLACGTGTCALVVAAVLEGRADRKCRVDLPGGPLDIEWDKASNHVFMTGAADFVFRGSAIVE
eukprot:jgi/Mesvir1/20252/Mv13485-RA.1